MELWDYYEAKVEGWVSYQVWGLASFSVSTEVAFWAPNSESVSSFVEDHCFSQTLEGAINLPLTYWLTADVYNWGSPCGISLEAV